MNKRSSACTDLMGISLTFRRLRVRFLASRILRLQLFTQPSLPSSSSAREKFYSEGSSKNFLGKFSPYARKGLKFIRRNKLLRDISKNRFDKLGACSKIRELRFGINSISGRGCTRYLQQSSQFPRAINVTYPYPFPFPFSKPF